MSYILNKQLIFTPRNNELKIIGAVGNSVVLSNAATRLLTDFIKNSTITVSRDELLKRVWEDFGFTPSNNNLYMAVSELRKSFIALEQTKDIIITVPKFGFRFNAHIDVKNDGCDAFEISSMQDNNIPKTGLEKLRVGFERCTYKNSFSPKKIHFIFLLLIFPMVVFVSFNKKFPFQALPASPSFSYGKCTIYLMNQPNTQDIESIKKNAKLLLDNNNVECGSNIPKSIYYQQNILPNNTLIEYTIGVCTKENVHCETIKRLAG